MLVNLLILKKTKLKLIILLIYFIKNLNCVDFDENLYENHKINKRMDLESCIGRFDVHEDTIIRTEESRAIGAKFLDNADLGSREECLRLCCETDGCDVFVFEEKSQGTCFLFQCGPPENFRCKFTRHFNYSSAVLTPIRQMIQVPTVPPSPVTTPQQQIQPISLSKHEMELDSLKDVKINRKEKTTTTTVIPALGVRLPEKITTKTTPVTSTQCSRFQFTCHSGECIAVYNACDGIPQCEDGSDEGPECPSFSYTITKIPPLGIVPNSIKNLNNEIESNRLSQQEQLPSRDLMPPSSNQDSIIKVSQIQQNQQIPRVYQSDSPQRNREDPMTAPQWPSIRQQNGLASSFIDTDSHIFNHKGGIQVASNNLPAQYSNSLHENNFGPNSRDNYMMTGQSNYGNLLNQQNPSLQQAAQQWLPDHRIPSRLDWPQPQMNIPQQNDLDTNLPSIQRYQPDLNTIQQIHEQQNQQQQLQQQIIKQQRPERPINQIPIKSNPESPIQKQLNKENKINESSRDVSSSESDDDSSDYEEEEFKTTTEAPKKKPKKHRNKIKDKKEMDGKNYDSKDKNSHKVGKVSVHDEKINQIIRNDLEIEFADHDGPAERPGGAVLSLTLGIIVTAALAILVGCRMRAVGRRIRRNGKSPYAHDTDFLVNGMYL